MNLSEYKFELGKTAIFKAVKMSRNPFFGLAGILKKLFLFLFITFSAISMLSIAELLTTGFSERFLLGIAFLFFGSFLLFWQVDSFFSIKIKHPKIGISLNHALGNPENFNLAGFFSFKIANAFQKSGSKNGSFPSLFLYHLLDDPDFEFIFSRMGIAISNVRKSLIEIEDEDPDLMWKLIAGALIETRNRNGKRIKKNDILVSAYENHPFFKNILTDKGIEAQDIRNLADWIHRTKRISENRKKFWKWKNLIKKGSLAKDWASGYTILLDRFSIDWTRKFKKEGFPEIIGHKEEIRTMERILSRKKINNILLVGDSGVGRRSMIYDLARRSFYGESLSEVNHKRIVEFDIPFLLANVENRDEMEGILEKIFGEVTESGNTILIIHDLHNFVGGGDIRPGKIDISGMMAHYLSLPQFQIIGITDYTGYRRVLEESSIAALFEKVEVSEISEEDTIRILQNMTLDFESRYKKLVSYQAIKEIINHSSRYLPSEPFPEKAINLLDEAMTYLDQTGEKILLPSHISKLISRKTNIPVGDMEKNEKNILLNLENLIHEKVINQEEAVREVSSALRRSRSEISSINKPMGTFLFLGPTGVGKTETAKALAEVYFGSPKRMIRIDMSEFQTLNDIPRLIGSSEYEGILTTKIKEDPFSLLLLDEIEKAHPDILNLFLQVLDEGHITDGMGRKINFKSSIIIATSNAGSDMILENIKKNLDWGELKEGLLDHLFSKAIFRPEFINRFDAVVLFSPLSKDNLLDITHLLLKKIAGRLKDKNIEFIITDELKEEIVEKGYNPTFGAREIKRVIQDKVENSLASALISGDIERGSVIKINPKTFEVEEA